MKKAQKKKKEQILKIPLPIEETLVVYDEGMILGVQIPEPAKEDLDTTMGETGDRMMRYRENPACPECGSHPVVCTMKRKEYASYRCRARECRNRFEVNG